MYTISFMSNYWGTSNMYEECIFIFQGLERTSQGLERTFQSLEHTFQSLEYKKDHVYENA